MDTTQYMLSTIDNPYNPFTQWDDWYAWDYRAGYHTPGYLARIVRSSDNISDADEQQSINDAIDEILEQNVLGVYVKISENNFKTI